MKFNKKATKEQMKNFNPEISTKQIVDEFIDDTIQSIRKLNTREYDINAYIRKKEYEFKRYENNYYKYKEQILSSDTDRELAYEKLEFAFDHVMELKEDLEMLRRYKA